MSVKISSAADEKVSITIDKSDLYFLSCYLSHAKFGGEIKHDILLSPFINELMMEIIKFSDANFLRGSGSIWKRVISKEDISNPHSFAYQVVKVLTRAFGEEEAFKSLADALYPNVLDSSSSGQ